MSFFSALFDFSFKEYVTTKIIKFLYVVAIILAALLWLGVLIASFTQGVGYVIGAIIICPIGFFLQVIFTRVGYEILIVVFGIAEGVRDMAFSLTGGRKAPVAPPPQPQYPQYQQPPQQVPQAPQQYPQYPQQPPQQPPQYPQYPQYPQQPPK